jgi:hypothetical protein
VRILQVVAERRLAVLPSPISFWAASLASSMKLILVAGTLLLGGTLVLLPRLGLNAVGWSYLGTQAGLAVAVMPFTVRRIRRVAFGMS